MSLSGRLHSMASGSFRDAKLERPVSGAELRRLLVASRPVAAAELWGKLSFNVRAEPRAEADGAGPWNDNDYCGLERPSLGCRGASAQARG